MLITRENVLEAILAYLNEDTSFPYETNIDESTSLSFLDSVGKALLALHLEDCYPLDLYVLPEDCIERFDTVGSVIDEVMNNLGGCHDKLSQTANFQN